MIDCQKEKMIGELKELLQHGYEIYVRNEDKYEWAIIITPIQNILYVQFHAHYDMQNGYDIYLKYQPSEKCGAECSARNKNDNPYTSLDVETMQIAEIRGLTLARKLKAQLYENAKQALAGVWNFDNYYKLSIEPKKEKEEKLK